MRSRLRRRTGRGLAVAALFVCSAVAAAPASQAATNGFVNFQLAGVPLAPVGVTCPGASNCYNHAAEPQIRADGFGRFFAASENGLLGGSDAWRSTDGGLHYTQIPSPDGAELPATAAGGDVDVAVAPDLNGTDRNYNVYVSSLNLASVYVATSRDGDRKSVV